MGGLDARTSAAGRGREARQAEQRKGGTMPSAATKPLTGVLPIAPTPFRDNGDLDLDGQRRVLDCTTAQGVDAICIVATSSEQFLRSDEERNTLLELCISHVRGRVPVIVTCSHF